jgi:hypothetical protein
MPQSCQRPTTFSDRSYSGSRSILRYASLSQQQEAQTHRRRINRATKVGSRYQENRHLVSWQSHDGSLYPSVLRVLSCCLAGSCCLYKHNTSTVGWRLQPRLLCLDQVGHQIAVSDRSCIGCLYPHLRHHPKLSYQRGSECRSLRMRQFSHRHSFFYGFGRRYLSEHRNLDQKGHLPRG